MDLLLDGRIALVTGASQGLGYAMALQFSREGALVAICSRDQAHVSAAADSIHAVTRQPVLGITADVSRSEDIGRLIERVVEEYGGLDILVANSGGPAVGPFEEITDEQWHDGLALLLMSAVRLVRAALPQLRQSPAPSVLTVTSISARQPIPNLTLSNTIRPAVLGLTKSLALELGRERIRVNSLLPGWTETERMQEILEDRAGRNATSLEVERAAQAAASALGRLATPAEIANAAVFLCSPAASYITGLMLSADGGTFRATT